MRFMMLMIPSAYQGKKGEQAGADFTPKVEAVERMMRYNEALAKSGALISLDGLHSPSTAARVSFSKGNVKVTDGPFVESKEVLGGYWMINVKSKNEAVEWAKKVPADDGDIIEVRRVFENDEFPEDVQKAADSPTVKAQLHKQQ
ncbi:MAG TPA: YciI family protein [Bacteroidota bacterium]|nr:YciI family protein [Bacteroidota bacterium]